MGISGTIKHQAIGTEEQVIDNAHQFSPGLCNVQLMYTMHVLIAQRA